MDGIIVLVKATCFPASWILFQTHWGDNPYLYNYEAEILATGFQQGTAFSCIEFCLLEYPQLCSLVSLYSVLRDHSWCIPGVPSGMAWDAGDQTPRFDGKVNASLDVLSSSS